MAYAPSPAAQARSSGLPVLRYRPASLNVSRAAAKAKSASMSGRVERYGGSVATKRYLFTPGPTPVPPEVLAAVGAPVLHHRSPDFLPVYERVLTRLREVCRTESDVLLFGASGTGAFESAVANLVSPGEPHLVVSAGNFGERWVSMVTAYGADVDVLRYAWGETPGADDLLARLGEREAKAVWLVQ